MLQFILQSINLPFEMMQITSNLLWTMSCTMNVLQNLPVKLIPNIYSHLKQVICTSEGLNLNRSWQITSCSNSCLVHYLQNKLKHFMLDPNIHIFLKLLTLLKNNENLFLLDRITDTSSHALRSISDHPSLTASIYSSVMSTPHSRVW